MAGNFVDRLPSSLLPAYLAAATVVAIIITTIDGNQGKRRLNSRTSRVQREDSIQRTVYVSDIDQQVTEEQLAALFINCGQVVDCHVCGDPNSVLSFAFVEFIDESAARAALSLAGTMLGYYRVRVLPSKTIISPVNPTFLPRVRDTIDFSGIEAVESVVQ